MRSIRSFFRNLPYKRIATGLAGLLLALLVVVFLRTLLFASAQPEPPGVVALHDFDEQALAERLAASLRIKTVSIENAPTRADAFFELHRHLERSFPRVHQKLEREIIAEYSLLYKWPGKKPDLKPILLMGHQDVVPVGLEEWEHPGFSGTIADGYIWGRGALDDKGAVLGLMEAAESLLAEGFQPERTIYFAFGHDEEIGGRSGAGAIGRLFREQAVEFEFIQDEGLAIVKGIIPGVKQPVALIGVAQKGEGSVVLTAAGDSGHSSMPPPSTTVGQISEAIVKIENSPMPAKIEGPIADMFDALGPEMNFGMRLVFANRWLFEPIVRAQLEAKNQTNAALRTTFAATMFQAGTKDNIIPYRARATVNFRIHPRDDIEKVREYIRRTIDDERIHLEVLPGARNPSPVSPVDSDRYRQFATTIREVFPEALVAPGLFIAISDTRHVQDLSENIYRFHPIVLSSEDTKRIHGVNERISIENYERYVQFFRRLMEKN